MDETRRSWRLLAVLTIVSLPIMILYAWLFIDSVSSTEPGSLLPNAWSFDNWSFLWRTLPGHPPIWTALLNTLIFTASVVAVVVSLSATAGYALSRLNFPLRREILSGMLILHAFPSVTLLISIFLMLRLLGLYDTLAGVILVKATLELPFAVWLMKGFYDTVPWEIEMAGLQDGATRFQVWWRLVLPQVGPGIAALAIFSFIASWAEFVLPFVLAPSADVRTLSVYMAGLVTDTMLSDYGLYKAVGIFYMIPVMIFFLFTQDRLMNIYGGGSKG